MRLDTTTVGQLHSGAYRGKQIMSSLARGQELRTLNILVSNNHTTARYPAIVARKLGLFERAGLKINYIDPRETADFAALLVAGEADAVMLDAPQTLKAIADGLAISAVYETMQHSPDVLAVVAGRPISSLSDLRGQTIGLASERDLAAVRLVLDSAGIGLDEVETTVVGDSGPVVARAIRGNEIAAYAGSVSDTTVLASLGIELCDLTPADLKANPANTFCVLAPRLEELRPHLQTYLRAWAMATRAAVLDPQAVTGMCQIAVPQEWQNVEAGGALMDAAVSLHEPVTEALGDPEPGLWAAVQGAYLRSGLIDAKIDPARFLDRSLIAAANDFTDAEVEATLDAWKAAGR